MVVIIHGPDVSSIIFDTWVRGAAFIIRPMAHVEFEELGKIKIY